MNNYHMKYIVFVIVSAVATPGWSLTVDQRVATLEKAVATLRTANTSLGTRVSKLETSNRSLTTKVTALQTDLKKVNTNTVLKLGGKLGLNTKGDTAVFKGLNVQIVNGKGTTNTVNGRGNLILGYNESSPGIHPVCSDGAYADQNACVAAGKIWSGSQHSGSHYLVSGVYNSYTQYGGLVTGNTNAATAPYANVSGGFGNTARRDYSSVSGGERNTASGYASSVTGGYNNTARGTNSSVSGGYLNAANGNTSTVSGGGSRTAANQYDWVAGGLFQDQ